MKAQVFPHLLELIDSSICNMNRILYEFSWKPEAKSKIQLVIQFLVSLPWTSDKVISQHAEIFKKALKGTIEPCMKIVMHKSRDQDEVLYQLARRTRDTAESLDHELQKCLAWIKDPEHWEDVLLMENLRKLDEQLKEPHEIHSDE